MTLMSAVATAARGKPPAPPLTAVEIKRRLDEAEASIPPLEAEHATAALNAEAQVEGAGQALIAIANRLEQTRQRIATLKAAHKAAVDREAAAERARRAELRRISVNEVKKHIAKRDDAMSRAAVAAENLALAFKEAAEHADAAGRVAGAKVPDGSLTTLGAIKRLISTELHRHTVPPQIGREGTALMLHGAEVAVSEMYRAAPPMMEAIKADTAWILRSLKGGE